LNFNAYKCLIGKPRRLYCASLLAHDLSSREISSARSRLYSS
jgi:hypothetical protein